MTRGRRADGAQGAGPGARAAARCMAGSGPAALAAGGADPARRRQARRHPRHHAARATLLRALPHLPDFLLSPYFAKGLALLRRSKSKVPVRSRRRIEAVGDDRLREVVSDRRADRGRSAAAAPGRRAQRQSRHGRRRRRTPGTSVSSASSRCSTRISAARRPASPWRAMARVSPAARRRPSAAVIAAIAAVRALARMHACRIRRTCASACSARRWAAPSSTGLNRPAELASASPRATPLVCRCEEVTAAQVRDTAPTWAARGPNQMKAFLRCGMGPCQGRLCGLTVTELIAAQRKIDAGRGRLLPPAPAGEAHHLRRARLAADQREPERKGGGAVTDGACGKPRASSRASRSMRLEGCGNTKTGSHWSRGPLLRMMFERTADAVIIGGGLHGCSTALHLAERGLEAGPGREGLRRPPRLGRQCRRRAPARAPPRRDPAVHRLDGPGGRRSSEAWSPTIAASRATVPCWWPRVRRSWRASAIARRGSAAEAVLPTRN